MTKNIFPFQYAFNLFSHNSPMTGNGYNEEEMKMVKETRKIWGVRFTACRLARGSHAALALHLSCYSAVFGALGTRMMIILTITDLN